MPNFRDTKAPIAYTCRTNKNDVHKSKNPEFRYWNYGRLDLDKKTNDECLVEFHFYWEDIYGLHVQLRYLHYAHPCFEFH